MTLVLTLLTQDYIVQVSDQRITTLPKLRLKDDKTVKAVLFNNQAVFAYTGLAQLPRPKRVQESRKEPAARIPTHMWLAEVLTEITSYDELHWLLVKEIEAAIAALRLPRQFRTHEFVGGMWATNDAGDGIEPVLSQVWNVNGSQEFRFGVTQLLDQPLAVHTSKPLPPKLDAELMASVEQIVAQKLGPELAGMHLMGVIRDAAGDDKTIGKSVIMSCLPRSQVERMLEDGSWNAVEGPPSLEAVTYQRIAAGTEVGERASPVVVFGKTIIKTLQIEHSATFQFNNDPPRLTDK